MAVEREFDGTVFLAHARSLFLLFLNSRHKSNLRPMQPYFSSELYKAWQSVKPARPDRRLSTRPVNYEITAADLTNHYAVQGIEVAIVAFTGLAVQVDARRKHLPRIIKERWTFTRPTDLVGQPCPSCGSPWTLNEWGKCRFCNRIFTGTTDGWMVGNVENLNPVTTALFQEENVFLDHWDETLRKIQSTPTRLS
jgi:hypothetical protein